jgi:hypothetical protein
MTRHLVITLAVLSWITSFASGQEALKVSGEFAKKPSTVNWDDFASIQTIEPIPRATFLPIESLTAESKKLSEELLLAALDSEALYTIVGQIKPVSEGFWGTYFPIEFADLTEIEKVREAVKPWSNGGCFAADVLIYEKQQFGRRYASLYLAHAPTLQTVMSKQAKFFNRFGLARDLPVHQVMMTIERSTSPEERWRGFGIAFGYPEYAIDFFVGAGLHQRETGEFIERDFRHIPTFKSKQGRFVYAVPKISPLRAEDTDLLHRAKPVLNEYRRLRAQYIGEGKPGPVALLRDWFDDGSGKCHPNYAIAKLDASKESQEETMEDEQESPSIPKPRVVFNHLYLVLDEETFNAFRSSDFVIHQLAASDQGFPKFEAINDSCQSIYLRGKDTYLEILGPHNKFGQPTGNIGLAWCVETKGAIDTVENQLRKADSELSRHLKRWDFDREGAVNWYHVVHRNFPASERFQWWFSEYHPDFTPALYPGSELGTKGILRHDFLSSRFDSTRHLANISSITMDLTPSHAKVLTRDLLAVGLRVESGDGRVSFLVGPDCTLVINSNSSMTSSRIKTIGFSTNSGKPIGLAPPIGAGITIQGDNDKRGWIDFGGPKQITNELKIQSP